MHLISPLKIDLSHLVPDCTLNVYVNTAHSAENVKKFKHFALSYSILYIHGCGYELNAITTSVNLASCLTTKQIYSQLLHQQRDSLQWLCLRR